MKKQIPNKWKPTRKCKVYNIRATPTAFSIYNYKPPVKNTIETEAAMKGVLNSEAQLGSSDHISWVRENMGVEIINQVCRNASSGLKYLCRKVLLIYFWFRYVLIYIIYSTRFIHTLFCSMCPPFTFLIWLVLKLIFFTLLLKFLFLQPQSLVHCILPYEI